MEAWLLSITCQPRNVKEGRGGVEQLVAAIPSDMMQKGKTKSNADNPLFLLNNKGKQFSNGKRKYFAKKCRGNTKNRVKSKAGSI
ncbi:hypothetical protein KFZ76_02555 [Methylovulum psychrotolerans]|uniref:hypothetical protein n=1 Tax=Methylovulum psychrotolerans TaxID=1704499 RepID=UPI001BFF7EC0|nr:hypothetical protein [Methylovulum psychrotolerans]